MQKNKPFKFSTLIIITLISFGLLLMACGDDEPEEAATPPPADTPTAVPNTPTPEPEEDEAEAGAAEETDDAETEDEPKEANESEEASETEDADAPEEANEAEEADASTPADESSIDMRDALRLEVQEGNVLEIWIDDVEDLAAIDFQMNFDPSKMQVLDADAEKDGVQIQAGEAPPADFIAQNTVDNESGLIAYATVRLPPTEAFSGSGLVATITWEAEFSLDDVTLGTVLLGDSEGLPVTQQITNGANE